MKLNKELFTKLNDAKKKADEKAMHIDLAIESLQKICDHQWESDPFAYQEPPSCIICGEILENKHVDKDYSNE